MIVLFISIFITFNELFLSVIYSSVEFVERGIYIGVLLEAKFVLWYLLLWAVHRSNRLTPLFELF